MAGLCAVDVFTGSADAPFVAENDVDKKVVSMEWMTEWTVRHLSMRGARTDSAKDIDPMRNALKMSDIYADMVTAQMIRFKAIRQRSVNVFIDPPMYIDHPSIDFEPPVSVLSRRSSPDDAIPSIDDGVHKSVDYSGWTPMSMKKPQWLAFYMARPRNGFGRNLCDLSASAFTPHGRII